MIASVTFQISWPDNCGGCMPGPSTSATVGGFIGQLLLSEQTKVPANAAPVFCDNKSFIQF